MTDNNITRTLRIQMLMQNFKVNEEEAGRVDDMGLKLAEDVLGDLNVKTDGLDMGAPTLTALTIYHALKSLEALAGIAADSITGDNDGPCMCVGCVLKRKLEEAASERSVH